MSSKTYEWKKKNRKKWLEQKARYRKKHNASKDKELNLIRIHSTRWIKPFLILKYGGCQFCKSTEKLEIHHIEYTTEFEDILLLCRKCHLNIHRSRKGGNV